MMFILYNKKIEKNYFMNANFFLLEKMQPEILMKNIKVSFQNLMKKSFISFRSNSVFSGFSCMIYIYLYFYAK